MFNKITEKYKDLVALFKGGYWNYRLIEKTISYKLKDGNVLSETVYEIYEVYYNEKNEIIAWTAEPMNLFFQSFNDYKMILHRIKNAVKRPILRLEDFKEEDNEKLIETNKYLKDIKEFQL